MPSFLDKVTKQGYLTADKSRRHKLRVTGSSGGSHAIVFMFSLPELLSPKNFRSPLEDEHQSAFASEQHIVRRFCPVGGSTFPVRALHIWKDSVG